MSEGYRAIFTSPQGHGELAVGLKSLLKLTVLDLVGHVLDIAEGALLISRSGRDGLRSVLALGIGASCLPTGGILWLGLGNRGSSRSSSRSNRGSRSSRLGGNGSGSGSGRSGGSRSTALALGRRSGGLGERDHRSRSGSGSGTAGPGHGLRGTSGLRSGSLRLSNLLGGGGRGGILRLLGSLSILLSEILGGGLGIRLGGLGLGGGLLRLDLLLGNRGGFLR
ncbi:unnamed protein product [Clonostachys solani]|uniref:Uncharacterized protein n=1 Tax=Clonostachys solani TaxID=160281 RepID=A0A9N9Z529_9HYPO|nr:unnamed protein product [Clonostachys solani]